MDYDLTDLEAMGADYERITEKLKDLRTRMRAEVIAANAAGVPQGKIVKASRYTREAVRLITAGSAPIATPK